MISNPYTPSLPEAPVLVPANNQTMNDSSIDIIKQMMWGNIIGPDSAPVQDAIRQGFSIVPVGNNPRGVNTGTMEVMTQKVMSFVDKNGPLIIMGVIGYAIISGLMSRK